MDIVVTIDSDDLQFIENHDLIIALGQHKQIILKSLPQKLKNNFVTMYNSFKLWRKENLQAPTFCENVILKYFNFLSVNSSASTLSSQFLMLKTTIMTFHNIDISNYYRVKLLIKNKKIEELN